MPSDAETLPVLMEKLEVMRARDRNAIFASLPPAKRAFLSRELSQRKAKAEAEVLRERGRFRGFSPWLASLVASEVEDSGTAESAGSTIKPAALAALRRAFENSESAQDIEQPDISRIGRVLTFLGWGGQPV